MLSLFLLYVRLAFSFYCQNHISSELVLAYIIFGYVEVVERNNELAALRNYTTGAPVVAATTKSLQEGARVRTAG